MKLTHRNKLGGIACAAVCLALSSGGNARAADNSKSKDKADQSVDELRREVATVKKTLLELLDLEKQRLEVLERGLQQGSRNSRSAKEEETAAASTSAEPAANTETASRMPPSLPPGKDDLTGVVGGRVKAPAGGPAFVFVEDVRGRMVRGRTISIRQKNKQFEPRWAVVQVGTKIDFPNNDPIYHNVFSRSPGNTFDLGIYRSGDDPKSWVTTKSGVVDLFCNMHPNMTASVLVVPNNYFAEVKADGTFMLADVPRGRHKIVAWAPNTQPVSEWVEVLPGKDVTVTFTLNEKGPGHVNKLGQSYGSYR